MSQSDCSKAGTCSCSCVRCVPPAGKEQKHCKNHGDKCHAECTE